MNTELTPRENEVMRTLNTIPDSGDKAMAAHLRISRKTVEAHIYNICRKLGVRNRTAALSRWLKQLAGALLLASPLLLMGCHAAKGELHVGNQTQALKMNSAEPEASGKVATLSAGTPGTVTTSDGFTYVASPDKPMFEFHDCLGNCVGRYVQDADVYGPGIVIDPGIDPGNCGMVHTRKIPGGGVAVTILP